MAPDRVICIARCVTYGQHIMGVTQCQDDDVLHARLFSLISRVDELRKEEKLLQEHILLLRREKAQREQKDSGGFEQIRRKELDLAEVRNCMCYSWTLLRYRTACVILDKV